MTDSAISHHIMVVDDEVNVLKALRRELIGNALYQIHTFKSPEVALVHAAIHRMDLLLTDYKMPWMHGLTFMKRMATLQPHINIIVISANAEEARRHCRFNEVDLPVMLDKPWHRNELLGQVANALGHHYDEKP